MPEIEEWINVEEITIRNNNACSKVLSLKLQNLEQILAKSTSNFVFHLLSIIIIIDITMNIQSWNFFGSPLKDKILSNQFKVSQFLQNFFSQSEKIQKQKSITISNHFQCNEEAKFIVNIAKFCTIFNISIESMKCLKTLSQKQKAYIKDYNFYSVLADTNRKPFTKSFQKSTNPQLNLAATFGNNTGLVLIIQHPENQAEKPKIKILNYENLMHTIINNFKDNQNFDQLNKLLDIKFKKIQSVICYDQTNNKTLNTSLIKFLLSKFNQVIYIAVLGDKLQNSNNQKQQNFNYENKIIKFIQSQNKAVITTNAFNNASQQKTKIFYDKYSKINSLIVQQIQKAKISKSVFNQNELCMSLYGVYYNFISLKNLENSNNIQYIQHCFLQKFLLQKCQHEKKATKDQKKSVSRKLGHYPVKITNGKKVKSKVCCVCDDNKKKSRYKCQKCSDTYSRDIAICLDHFKLYHDNIHKYIPKGVRKGAYKNQIMQFMEAKQQLTQDKNIEQSQSNSLKATDQIKQTEDIEKILSKWDSKLERGLFSLKETSIGFFQCCEPENYKIIPPLIQMTPYPIGMPISRQFLSEVKKEEM